MSHAPTQTMFGLKYHMPKKIFKVMIDIGSPYLVTANGMEHASYLDNINDVDVDNDVDN